MITNILIFLWLALILVILSLLVRNRLNKTTEYPFQDSEKTDMPYISLDIQGHKFNMITDSAAAVSVIRRDAVSLLNYEPSPRKVSLTALTNDGVDNEVIILPINMNGKEIKTDFVIYEGSDMADFSRKHGVIIHGILGVEFFRKTKGKVDFKTQSVVFP